MADYAASLRPLGVAATGRSICPTLAHRGTTIGNRSCV